MDLMVIGVLPGHKGRIGHHDHTHFIGQTPSCEPDRRKRIVFLPQQPFPTQGTPCATASPRPFSRPPPSPPSRLPSPLRPARLQTIPPATSARSHARLSPRRRARRRLPPPPRRRRTTRAGAGTDAAMV